MDTSQKDRVAVGKPIDLPVKTNPGCNPGFSNLPHPMLNEISQNIADYYFGITI